MKINVTQKLQTINGDVLVDTDEKGEAVAATLRMAIVNALLSPVQKENGMEKAKKFDLALTIYNNDEVELDEHAIVLIKERIGELYPPLIVGQIYNILKV